VLGVRRRQAVRDAAEFASVEARLRISGYRGALTHRIALQTEAAADCRSSRRPPVRGYIVGACAE
jgi:hypothetical protein